MNTREETATQLWKGQRIVKKNQSSSKISGYILKKHARHQSTPKHMKWYTHIHPPKGDWCKKKKQNYRYVFFVRTYKKKIVSFYNFCFPIFSNWKCALNGTPGCLSLNAGKMNHWTRTLHARFAKIILQVLPSPHSSKILSCCNHANTYTMFAVGVNTATEVGISLSSSALLAARMLWTTTMRKSPPLILSGC